MKTTAACAILLLLALPATAQEDAPPQDSTPEWSLRLGAQAGVAYFTYEETLSSANLKTDFDTAGFAGRITLEANLSHVSPFVDIETTLSSGDEEARLLTIDQENDLGVATILVDMGVGYRIDLGVMTVVPAIAYTLEVVGFSRSSFSQNGTRVDVVDLDGQRLSSVEEDFIGHGVTGRLAVEIEASSMLSLVVMAVYSHLPEVEVDNEIGGSISTDGYLVRGSISFYLWLQPRIALTFGSQIVFQELDESDPKVRTGSAGSAVVQFPESETLYGTVMVGLSGRF